MTFLFHHPLGTLAITRHRYSSEQTEYNEGKVDHILEEQDEVDVEGRGGGDLELQPVLPFFQASFQISGIVNIFMSENTLSGIDINSCKSILGLQSSFCGSNDVGNFVYRRKQNLLVNSSFVVFVFDNTSVFFIY